MAAILSSSDLLNKEFREVVQQYGLVIGLI